MDGRERMVRVHPPGVLVMYLGVHSHERAFCIINQANFPPLLEQKLSIPSIPPCINLLTPRNSPTTFTTHLFKMGHRDIWNSHPKTEQGGRKYVPLSFLCYFFFVPADSLPAKGAQCVALKVISLGMNCIYIEIH